MPRQDRIRTEIRTQDSGNRWPAVARASATSLAAGILLAGGLPAAAQIVAQDVDYHCTVIASTEDFPDGLRGWPTINSEGRVAFQARIPFPGSVEVRSGNGSVDAFGRPLTTPIARSGQISDPDAHYSGIALKSLIGEDGKIYWHALSEVHPGASNGGGHGLYRKHWNEAISIQAESVVVSTADNPPGSITVFDDATANSTGYALFTGSRAGPSYMSGLFYGQSENASLIGPSNAQEIAMHPGVLPWYGYVSYMANQLHIWVSEGVPLVSVDYADRNLEGISVNGTLAPTVSFIEGVYGDPNQSWLLRRENSILGEILLDDQFDTTGFNDRPNQTAMNGYGEVALSGVWFGEPLLVTDGDTAHRVHCANELSIPGVRTRRIHLSPRAINNDGQIAFRAETAQNVPATGADVAYILRADPLTTAHPSSCVAIPDGTPCDDGDPMSLAYCNVGLCEVPEPGFGTTLALAFPALLALARRRPNRGRDRLR